jgi:hypothetical protein
MDEKDGVGGGDDVEIGVYGWNCVNHVYNFSSKR